MFGEQLIYYKLHFECIKQTHLSVRLSYSNRFFSCSFPHFLKFPLNEEFNKLKMNSSLITFMALGNK